MMGGVTRPAVGGLMILVAGYLLYSHARNGWKLEDPGDRPILREG
jgi:hypothetical protein